MWHQNIFHVSSLAFLGICFLTINFSKYPIASAAAILPRKLGQINVNNVGFLQILSKVKQTGDDDPFDPDDLTLYISTFDTVNVPGNDTKFVVKGPGKYLGENLAGFSEALESVSVDGSLFCPHNPDYLNANVFGDEAVSWPSGCVVPGKTVGKIDIHNLSNISASNVNIASLDTLDWSYQHTIWTDMNADGHVDAVTARVRRPSDGPSQSEFLWLENPGGPLAEEGWTQHILVPDGPKSFFQRIEIVNSDERTYDCFFTINLRTEPFSLYCIDEDAPGGWTNDANIFKVIIDPLLTPSDAGIDCQVVDLNNDGRLDLLATIFTTSGGYIMAYEIPQDFPSGVFIGHQLAPAFSSNNSDATPGSVLPFHRHVVLDMGTKPSLLLSGFNDGHHYILTPLSVDDADWNYVLNILVDTGGAVAAAISLADLDGDGWTEILTSGYSSGFIYVYTFGPIKYD